MSVERPVGGSIRKIGGVLEYSFEQQNEGQKPVCYIESIEAFIPGIGRKLVKELVDKLGPNYPISGLINELSTRQLFRDKGLFELILSQSVGTNVAIDHSIYRKSKIFRMCNRGGIDINSMEMIREPDSESRYFVDDIPVRVKFFGYTRF